MDERRKTLDREKRWGLISGIAAVAGVALILASFGDSAAAIRSGEGIAASLRELNADSGTLFTASILQAVGWLLLAVPLVFLFRAASARTERVRRGLIGVVIIAPLFLAVGSLLSAIALDQAASSFVATPAAEIQRCIDSKVENANGSDSGKASDAGTGDKAKGGKPSDSKSPTEAQLADYRTSCEDRIARDERTGTSVAGLETGFGLAGLLGFTIAVVYTALWGLRTGLLTRFWGSLGIALGAVFAFFTLFTLVWFIYLGLLLAGWVPGGRPPAWAEGRAIPWPKGGSLFGGPARESEEDAAIEAEAEEVADQGGPVLAPPVDDFDGTAPERRKRKKRDA